MTRAGRCLAATAAVAPVVVGDELVKHASMAQENSFSRQLAAAARAMQAETGTQHTIEKAVASATEIVHGCDMAGVSVVRPGGIDTTAASDEALARIDALQYAINEGPCLDALQQHETVTSPDLAEDQRWPKWGPTVVEELGLRSVLSFRLYSTKDTLGALNLYADRVDAFDSDDIYNGLALAAHVGVALAGAQNVENLERAITNRTVIGQAEGILMERFDISAERAFAVLRRVSQERNVKLHKVADELVVTRQVPR